MIKPKFSDMRIDTRINKDPMAPFGINPEQQWAIFYSVRLKNEVGTPERSVLGEEFGFCVCSPSYAANVSEPWEIEFPKHVQDRFDEDEARTFLQEAIDSVGQIPEWRLSPSLRAFVSTKEWDQGLESEARESTFDI